MLVSWQLLAKHFTTPRFVTVPKLVDTLNQIGVEVEEVTNYHELNTKLCVGEVVKCEKHPHADRLNCCTVNVGTGTALEIVCGAENARAGIKVVVALVGSRLANGITIVARDIRKKPSNGMLCAYTEIGVAREVLPEELVEGIIELPSSAVPGDSNPLQYLEHNDVVLNLKFASNRSDLLSLRGIARDLVAFLGGKLARLPNNYDVSFPNSTTPHIAHHCARSLATLNLRKLPSSVATPDWMQFALWKSGFKTIHPAVDIANYVMLETGQPLHAYDRQAVGAKITATKSSKDFLFTGLDDRKYQLKKGDVVITNEQKEIVSLAGIFGNKSSGIKNGTTDVTVEAGSFEPSLIAKTSKRLDLLTGAAQRFAKGVDPLLAERALKRYAFLAREIYKDVQISDVNAILETIPKREISLPNKLVNQTLGTKFTLKEISETLTNLGLICVSEAQAIRVEIPTFRPDLLEAIDLVEEVLRMHNIDELPTTPPVQSIKLFSVHPDNQLLDKTRHFMQSCRFHEIKTYALTSTAVNKVYNPFKYDELPGLTNPLGQHREVMRLSLLPSLLDVTSSNERHLRAFEKEWRSRLGQLNFFEVSDLNHANGANVHLGIIFNEAIFASNQDWFSNTEAALLNEIKPSFYAFKGIVQSWLKEVVSASQCEKISFTQESLAGDLMHPFNTLVLKIGDQMIGYFGELHPQLLAKFNLQNSRFAGEFNLSVLDLKEPLKKLADPNYQEIQRDFSVITTRDEPNALLKCDLEACHPAITAVSYCGSFALEKGYSATFRVFSKAPLKNSRLIGEVREAVLAVFRKHKLVLKQ